MEPRSSSSAESSRQSRNSKPAAPQVVSAQDLFKSLTTNSSRDQQEGAHSQAHIKQPAKLLPIFEEVCRKGAEIITSVPDPKGLGQPLLRYVAHQFNGRRDIGILLKVLEAESSLASSPTSRLLAIAQFGARDLWIEESQVPMIVAYSQVLEELLTNPRGFLRGAFRSLERQWGEYLASPEPWHHKLQVLSSLLVAEARSAGPQFIALDLLSENSSIVQRFAAACPYPEDEAAALKIIALAVEREVNALPLIRFYISSVDSSHGKSRLPSKEAISFLTKILSLPICSSKFVEQATKEYKTLFREGVAPELRSAFVETLSFVTTPQIDTEVSWLAKTFAELGRTQIQPHKIRYFLTTIENREIRSFAELKESLSKLLGMRQLEGFSSRVLGGDDSLLRELAGAYSHRGRVQRGTLPQLLQARLQVWEDVQDIHRGFTSRLSAARRTPFREPPDLVQFATDVGGDDSVKYINAESPNLFPGKGFLFTRLKFERCFAPMPSQKGGPSKDPFGVYRDAWPELSPVFADFYHTEYIFLRGLIAISCKRPSYNLVDADGVRRHYALVVFNDHFRNPFQEVAYLVPVEGLKPLLQGAQVSANDFVGFDSRRKDVNAVMISPREFINSPGIKGRAIDIGGIQAILGGVSNSANANDDNNNSFLSIALESEKLSQDLRHYNQKVKRWESLPHSYHTSDAGRDALRLLSDEYKQIISRQTDLDNRVIEASEDTERDIWELANKYVSLHKLFCIAHAYWHKGYTLGKVVSTEHISLNDSSDNESFPQFESTIRQDISQISSSSDTPVNRNALRMLVQAYELHSQRKKANANRSDFPLLVTCNALKTGVHPDTDFVLDTYDMTITLGKKKIRLSQEGMTSDDELFWLTSIFPNIKDEPGVIRDLRFYPRESLGPEYE